MFGEFLESFFSVGFLIKFSLIMLPLIFYVIKFAPVGFFMKIGFILAGGLGAYMALAGKSLRQRK